MSSAWRSLSWKRSISAGLGSSLWRMTWMTLGQEPGARQGVVEVPVGERSEEGARVSALVAGMAPGSVLLETDWERRVMRFHVADASEPEVFRAGMERFYREYQRAVFP